MANGPIPAMPPGNKGGGSGRLTSGAAEQAAREATPEPPDPLLPQAVAILEERGDTELLRRLPLHWPHMDAATRRLLVEGKASFRVYLREG
jgi:hypothetical protein